MGCSETETNALRLLFQAKVWKQMLSSEFETPRSCWEEQAPGKCNGMAHSGAVALGLGKGLIGFQLDSMLEVRVTALGPSGFWKTTVFSLKCAVHSPFWLLGVGEGGEGSLPRTAFGPERFPAPGQPSGVRRHSTVTD